MLALIGAPIVVALAAVVVFVLWSRGEPAGVVDAAGRPVIGSLSEKVFVEINGVRQGMFIVSRDAANPVLLFLHGGPGLPEFFLAERATRPAWRTTSRWSGGTSVARASRTAQTSRRRR